MSFDPPEYIVGKALDEWNRLLPYMEDKGFDEPQYLMKYASYCVGVMQFEESLEEINRVGYLIEGRNESLVKNPAFTTLKEANERIAQGSRAFGFSPEDHKNLKLEEATTHEDEFDDVL